MKNFEVVKAWLFQADAIMKRCGVGFYTQLNTEVEIRNLLKEMRWGAVLTQGRYGVMHSIWKKDPRGDIHLSYGPIHFMMKFFDACLGLLESQNPERFVEISRTCGRFAEDFDLVLQTMDEMDQIRRIIGECKKYPSKPYKTSLEVSIPKKEEGVEEKFRPLLYLATMGIVELVWNGDYKFNVCTNLSPEEVCKQGKFPASVTGEEEDEDGNWRMRILYNLDSNGERIREYAPNLKNYWPKKGV